MFKRDGIFIKNVLLLEVFYWGQMAPFLVHFGGLGGQMAPILEVLGVILGAQG